MLSKEQRKNSLLLKKAKAILKKGWCKKSFAKTKNSRETRWNNKSATNFCMLGAIYKANNSDLHTIDLENYLEIACKNIDVNAWTPADFNDKHSKQAVLKAYDAAIALAIADESGVAT